MSSNNGYFQQPAAAGSATAAPKQVVSDMRDLFGEFGASSSQANIPAVIFQKPQPAPIIIPPAGSRPFIQQPFQPPQPRLEATQTLAPLPQSAATAAVQMNGPSPPINPFLRSQTLLGGFKQQLGVQVSSETSVFEAMNNGSSNYNGRNIARTTSLIGGAASSNPLNESSKDGAMPSSIQDGQRQGRVVDSSDLAQESIWEEIGNAVRGQMNDRNGDSNAPVIQKFFIIKNRSEYFRRVALEQNICLINKNCEALGGIFKGSENIYLIFSSPTQRQFFGYAIMAAEVDECRYLTDQLQDYAHLQESTNDEYKDYALIKWCSQTVLRHDACASIKNAWNDYQSVYVSKELQQVDSAAAQKLLELFDNPQSVLEAEQQSGETEESRVSGSGESSSSLQNRGSVGLSAQSQAKKNLLQQQSQLMFSAAMSNPLLAFAQQQQPLLNNQQVGMGMGMGQFMPFARSAMFVGGNPAASVHNLAGNQSMMMMGYQNPVAAAAAAAASAYGFLPNNMDTSMMSGFPRNHNQTSNGRYQQQQRAQTQRGGGYHVAANAASVSAVNDTSQRKQSSPSSQTGSKTTSKRYDNSSSSRNRRSSPNDRSSPRRSRRRSNSPRDDKRSYKSSNRRHSSRSGSSHYREKRRRDSRSVDRRDEKSTAGERKSKDTTTVASVTPATTVSEKEIVLQKECHSRSNSPNRDREISLSEGRDSHLPKANEERQKVPAGMEIEKELRIQEDTTKQSSRSASSLSGRSHKQDQDETIRGQSIKQEKFIEEEEEHNQDQNRTTKQQSKEEKENGSENQAEEEERDEDLSPKRNRSNSGRRRDSPENRRGAAATDYKNRDYRRGDVEREKRGEQDGKDRRRSEGSEEKRKKNRKVEANSRDRRSGDGKYVNRQKRDNSESRKRDGSPESRRRDEKSYRNEKEREKKKSRDYSSSRKRDEKDKRRDNSESRNYNKRRDPSESISKRRDEKDRRKDDGNSYNGRDRDQKKTTTTTYSKSSRQETSSLRTSSPEKKLRRSRSRSSRRYEKRSPSPTGRVTSRINCRSSRSPTGKSSNLPMTKNFKGSHNLNNRNKPKGDNRSLSPRQSKVQERRRKENRNATSESQEIGKHSSRGGKEKEDVIVTAMERRDSKRQRSVSNAFSQCSLSDSAEHEQFEHKRSDSLQQHQSQQHPVEVSLQKSESLKLGKIQSVTTKRISRSKSVHSRSRSRSMKKQQQQLVSTAVAANKRNVRVEAETAKVASNKSSPKRRSTIQSVTVIKTQSVPNKLEEDTLLSSTVGVALSGNGGGARQFKECVEGGKRKIFFEKPAIAGAASFNGSSSGPVPGTGTVAAVVNQQGQSTPSIEQQQSTATSSSTGIRKLCIKIPDKSQASSISDRINRKVVTTTKSK